MEPVFAVSVTAPAPALIRPGMEIVPEVRLTDVAAIVPPIVSRPVSTIATDVPPLTVAPAATVSGAASFRIRPAADRAPSVPMLFAALDSTAAPDTMPLNVPTLRSGPAAPLTAP